MTLIKTIIAFTSLATLAHVAFAQEGLRELQYNSAQHFHVTKPLPQHPQTRASLPFVDDFSTSDVVPDPAKWIGTQVFINSTCPVNPPSIGVATFDGLAANGLPYNETGTSLSAEPADTLTSVKIDLSTKSPADNVYLSFLYQPQGLCDFPNNGDSLVLEFRIDSARWIQQWSVNGFNSAPQDIRFQWVMIRLDSASFFTDSFQFRFRNRAAITGNNDHWHIDYVQLDANRSADDTTLNDIAIQYPMPPLLRNYSEMPWNHFKANAGNETRSQVEIFSRNNYTTDKNTSYGYFSVDEFSGFTLSNPPLASFNFAAQSNDSLQLSPVDFNPVINNDSALIKTTYFTFLSGSPDELPANDTMVHYQRFRNYFAYDDGTAEKAYYLQGQAAQAALRFHANVPDSVQGVKVHWARVAGPQINLLFSVIVWKSILNNEVLYQRDFLHPVYVDSVNGFTTYMFDSAIAVTDTFYVGWLQSQINGMDIGFDKNTDAHTNFAYNLGTQWLESTQKGSLMIRPVMGSREGIFETGIKDTKQPDWFAYPNPSNGNWLRVSGAPDRSRYELIDALGKTISAGDVFSERIEMPPVSKGLYLLRVTSAGASKTFRIAVN